MLNTWDEHFMQRALQLAQLGMGQVAPNPMVGCVIVHDNQIIGEGWHQRYGQAHAEVVALNSVTERHLLPKATVYVTLEPCSHYGKTPPCADRLIQEKVKRIVVCNDDPNPLVAGKGFQKLRDAGIEVVRGILANQGRFINRRFFTYFEQNRPYVILKWAETADGFLAAPDYLPIQISNALSKRLVHKWRSEEAAIWVGTNTARQDNPHLNVRLWQGRNPLRVVLDRQLSLPNSLHLFDDSQPTLIFNTREEKQVGATNYVIPAEWAITGFLETLRKCSLQSVLVEGGTRLLESFLEAGMWDEIRLFRSPKRIHAGITAPRFEATLISTDYLLADELTIWSNPLTA
ncbi:MAG: bifunctional diaminohydroxyphosphoribosylaminopyrimidine deaminase/5-amino-6-(5-phosphoribosylamino)uracil reductase RibD [Siphonobacter sp.]